MTNSVPAQYLMVANALELVVIGSGQDAGLPQFGAFLPLDEAARARPDLVRLGPSLCLVHRTPYPLPSSTSSSPSPSATSDSVEKEPRSSSPYSTSRALLIDASPDLKTQFERLLKDPAYAARYVNRDHIPPPAESLTSTSPASSSPTSSRIDNIRIPPFDAIALTHAHMGHYGGLLHFGREAANTQGVPLYCTERMAQFLTRNAPWSQLVSLGNVALRKVEPLPIDPPPSTEFDDEPPAVTLWDGVYLRFYEVPHRAEFTDTVGISINDQVIYIPDIDGWDQWPCAERVIGRHEIAIVDATFYSAKELPDRDISKIPHPLVENTVAKFLPLLEKSSAAVSDDQSTSACSPSSSFKTKRIILSHLNHSNPLCDAQSEEACRVTSLGFEIASEMLRIPLRPASKSYPIPVLTFAIS